MNEKTVEIAIPILLPDIQDERDQCIARLQTLLQGMRGIFKAHLEKDHQPVDLCIHYDPNLITLASVERLAKETGSSLTNGYHHEQIPFNGLESADSAVLLQTHLERLPGMLHARVNYTAGMIFTAYDAYQLSRSDIDREIQEFGVYPSHTVEKTAALPFPVPGLQPAFTSWSQWFEKYHPLVLTAISGVLLLAGWLGEVSRAFLYEVSLTLFLLSAIAGGFDVARHALHSLMRGEFDTDVLMLAAAVGAAFLGEWAEGAFLLFLFSLGHAGEHYALEKARSAIGALGELMPRTARVRHGSRWSEVAVEEIVIGDHVLVRPADRVPVDGELISGMSAIDQSPITGESLPVSKQPGDPVYTGTINGEAALEVRVTHLKEDTTLSRVIAMVAEAQNQRSPTQLFTEKFTARFVPAVLTLVVLVAVLPPVLGWLPFSESFYRAMLLLVAASPCALALGTPAAVLAGIAQAARNGVLIKGGAYLENLGRVRVMAFDKTGTLTRGKFQLSQVVPLNGVHPHEILRIAAEVEQQSNHPLAQAVLDAAREKNLEIRNVSRVENVPGLGLRSEIDGKSIWVGSLKPVVDIHGEELAAQACDVVQRLEKEGHTTMVVARDGLLLGVLGLVDAPRHNLSQTLDRLQKQGIEHLVMLTGDNQAAAEQVASQAGITRVEAGLLPEEKLITVERLSHEYGPVAMVGDGVNDAPALAAASVGIAMGGVGTAVALETADIALMADDLEKLPFAVGLSRASRSIIQQNLAISLGVIGMLVLSSVLGWIGLSWAVVFHEGSTILVVLNALRLLGYRQA